jgi:tRNA C32,U32 (ribose-2'-O)-methylase TrmJ
LEERESLSLHTQGNTMSRLIRASSASRSAKARRMLQALRKSCTQARLTDRELMAMRTNLSRHSGCGASSAQA